MIRLALALVLAVAAGACDKDPDRVTPFEISNDVSVAEATSGREACDAFAERACSCAAKVPDVQATCDDAKALPEALQMTLRAASSKAMKAEPKSRLQLEVRRIISRCIEGTAALAARCP